MGMKGENEKEKRENEKEKRENEKEENLNNRVPCKRTRAVGLQITRPVTVEKSTNYF